MTYQQNEDGTWGKAEPEKASWECNKLLQFFRKLFSKDKCFQKYKSKDGKCYGICGGDKSTDYLSYSCISCKYLCYKDKIHKD